MFEPEEKQYIDPPPRRKDLPPEDPITRKFKAFIFQLRKRDIKVVKKCK